MGKNMKNEGAGRKKEEEKKEQVENCIIKVCQGSPDPVYIVSYYIKWVKTSWTYSTIQCLRSPFTIHK